MDLQNLDFLILGLKNQLRDRHFYSDDEVVAVKCCIKTLQKCKLILKQKKPPDINMIIKVVDLLIRIFEVSTKIKDIL